jgi:hypothetical protein
LRLKSNGFPWIFNSSNKRVTMQAIKTSIIFVVLMCASVLSVPLPQSDNAGDVSSGPGGPGGPSGPSSPSENLGFFETSASHSAQAIAIYGKGKKILDAFTNGKANDIGGKSDGVYGSSYANGDASSGTAAATNNQTNINTIVNSMTKSENSKISGNTGNGWSRTDSTVDKDAQISAISGADTNTTLTLIGKDSLSGGQTVNSWNNLNAILGAKGEASLKTATNSNSSTIAKMGANYAAGGMEGSGLAASDTSVNLIPTGDSTVRAHTNSQSSSNALNTEMAEGSSSSSSNVKLVVGPDGQRTVSSGGASNTYSGVVKY